MCGFLNTVILHSVAASWMNKESRKIVVGRRVDVRF